jgi:hypothetical protein
MDIMSYCTTKRDVLLTKIMEYYSNTDNIDLMLDIINGNSRLSLRVVDWFVTNYSKLNFTCYLLDNGDRFKVYEEYKLNLKAYSKKQFDPFCRWERITIPYGDQAIQTTIGQLNFFKWAFENNIIKYIEEHHNIIEDDMNTRSSTSRRQKVPVNETKTRKKREELSISATKSVLKENVKITVSFN